MEALIAVYPEVKFDVGKFKLKTSMFVHFDIIYYTFILFIVHILTEDYWDDNNNRKAFLDEFAKKNNFDPLNPNAWYSISNEQIKTRSFVSQLIIYYSLLIIINHLTGWITYFDEISWISV